jgi:hypothetical protein
VHLVGFTTEQSVANVIYPEIVENCWNEDGMMVPDIIYLKNTRCNT